MDDNGVPTLPLDFMNNRIATQPARYDKIDTWLKSAGVSPDRVFMFDYPNSTRDANGNSCTAANSSSSMTQDEWLWNEAHVAYPLNNAVATAISVHGWQPVTGFGPLFERHGYCTTDRWITTLQDSIAKQGGIHGAFHPNPKGHELYRDRIAEALKGQLFVNGEPRPAQNAVQAPTLLADDTGPGAKEVPVKRDHFQIGDRVVIDPGTGIAEVATITGKGSLIFDHPLVFAHRAGTLIVLDGELPGALALASQPIPAEATPTTAPAGNVPSQILSPSGAATPSSNGVPPSGTSLANTSLPATGYDPRRLSSLAVLLLGAGGIALWFRRRRAAGADLGS